MKRIRILGLTVIAVFATSALASSVASAAEWLDNGKPITNPILVLLKGTGATGQLELSDLAATGGATAIVCESKGDGTIGPGANDTIKTIAAPTCSFVAGKNGSCEASKPVTATPVNLPWATRLLTVNGEVRDMIENSGPGAPGWQVECTVAGIFKVQDKCTSETGDPLIDNNPSGNDVIALFEASETATCSLGNSTSGMVVGAALVFSDVPGLKLSVDP